MYGSLTARFIIKLKHDTQKKNIHYKIPLDIVSILPCKMRNTPWNTSLSQPPQIRSHEEEMSIRNHKIESDVTVFHLMKITSGAGDDWEFSHYLPNTLE